MVEYTGRRPRLAMTLVGLLICAALAAGCGSGALRPPSVNGQGKGGAGQGKGGAGQGKGGAGQDKGGAGHQGTSGGGQGKRGAGRQGTSGGGKEKFSWFLPAGDTSPTGNEGSLYGVLRSCGGAEDTIANAWQGFNSPRNVLMYMAAAHLCHGDTAGGRPFYQRAASEYGLSGFGGPDTRSCDVYRSVASVLLQASRESFACLGGNLPEWKTGPGGTDNPLTFDVDESQVSSSSSSSTTTTTIDSAATTSSGSGETSTTTTTTTTTSGSGDTSSSQEGGSG